jgi:thioredoxin-related protein
MKFLSMLFLSLFIAAAPVWETDFDKAVHEAQNEHRPILLSFSGSDWCIPCIKLHKEIFESEAFISFAGSNLVLVNADFPRLKKNQLPKEQQKKNEQLADRYNPEGKFPLTVLLDENGKVIRQWEGYPKTTPEEFIAAIKTDANARN